MAARIQEIQKVIFTRIHVFLPSELDLIVISKGKSDSPPREMRPKLALRPEKVEGGGGLYWHMTVWWHYGGNRPRGRGWGWGGRHRRWLGITQSMEGCDATPSLLTIVPLARSRSYLRFLQVSHSFFFPPGFYSIVLYLPGVLFVHGGGEGGRGG